MSSRRSMQSGWEPPSPACSSHTLSYDADSLYSPTNDDDDYFQRQLSSAEIQRRRLDKLTRTLGEQIPAELIMNIGVRRPGGTNPPPTPTDDFLPVTKDTAKALLRRASLSLSTFTRLPAPHYDHVYQEGSNRRKDDVAKGLHEVHAAMAQRRQVRPVVQITAPPRQNSLVRPESTVLSPILFSEPDPVSPRRLEMQQSKASVEDITEVGSGSTTFLVDLNEDASSSQASFNHSREQTPVHRTVEEMNLLYPPRAETPFLDHLVPNESGMSAPTAWFTTKTGVVRSERRQGWSGQWNQPDMQDVISKLRNLK